MPRTENLKRIGNMEQRKGRRLIWCWRKNEVGGLQCRWETAKKYFKGLTEKGKNSALKTQLGFRQKERCWELDCESLFCQVKVL